MPKKERVLNKFVFAKNLAELIGETPQKDIAEQIGISEGTISRWLNPDYNNVNVSADHLIKIVKHFGGTVDDLLGLSEETHRRSIKAAVKHIESLENEFGSCISIEPKKVHGIQLEDGERIPAEAKELIITIHYDEVRESASIKMKDRDLYESLIEADELIDYYDTLSMLTLLENKINSEKYNDLKESLLDSAVKKVAERIATIESNMQGG